VETTLPKWGTEVPSVAAAEVGGRLPKPRTVDTAGRAYGLLREATSRGSPAVARTHWCAAMIWESRLCLSETW